MPRPLVSPRNLAVALALACGTTHLVSADVLHLAGGGRIEGILVEDSPSRVTVEVSTGRISLPRTRVTGIERTQSALAVFRSRLALVAPNDTVALVELARFAASSGLTAETRLAWTRVLALDPANAEAHLALGHVLFRGTWLEPEEAYRAQGLVPFEGRWVTPFEQEAAMREREQRVTDDRRVEDARRAAREAEERARRAEAEAAKARAETSRFVGSSPWGHGGPVIVGGPSWIGGSGCLRLPCDGESPRPAPTPAPRPRHEPTPVRPSSIH